MERFEIVEVRVVLPSPVRVVKVPPDRTDEQFIVPVPAIVASEAPVAALSSVTPVVTSNVTPALTVNVLVAPALNVIELMTVLVVTVMSCPGAMITSSAAVGMKPPGQGAFGVVEFQFPSPAEVTVTARLADALASTKTTMTTICATSFFSTTAGHIDGLASNFSGAL
jgi:hypothetical protein